MVRIHNGMLSSLKEKEKETLPFATTWMKLEGIILDKISQTEKHKYRMLSLTHEIEKNVKLLKAECTRWLPGTKGMEETGRCWNRIGNFSYVR